MMAEHADLSGHKSLGYASFFWSCSDGDRLLLHLTIQAIVSSLTSVDECAGPEHHGFHTGTVVWSRASFHHTVLIKMTRQEASTDMTAPLCRITVWVNVKAKRHGVFDANRCVVSQRCALVSLCSVHL